MNLLKTMIFCLVFISSANFAFAKDEEIKEAPPEKYVSESTRARLNEIRKCTRENPGNTWNECRYACVDACNEISDTYARGVCNGALIQICCGQFPSGCK